MSSVIAPHIPASALPPASRHFPPVTSTPLSDSILHRPILSGLILTLSDLAAISIAFWSSVFFWMYVKQLIHPLDYVPLWPALFAFPVAYYAAGLYPAIALHPAEEIRRSAAATACVYLLLGTATFFTREAELYSRAVFFIALLQTCTLVPLFRYLLKRTLARRRLWGCAAVVIGEGPSTISIMQALHRDPSLGLHPVAVIPPTATYQDHRIPYAIVTHPASFRRACDQFPNVLLIPDLFNMSTLSVAAVDLGGLLGLESRQNLLRSGAQFIKRGADLFLAGFLLLLSLPVVLIIAFCIKLSSPGPVFYSQLRCGRNGSRFRAWKFRTMIPNADRVLKIHLRRNPGLRSEWNAGRKLHDDPRVTPIGRILRHTSLDELPQLFNVLTGDMSLVGPRPIVEAEIARYQDDFAYYSKVRPGITGLWQVSGRNRLSYAERIRLDSYYIRNWSPWLDVYILGRTVKVVITGDGAW